LKTLLAIVTLTSLLSACAGLKQPTQPADAAPTAAATGAEAKANSDAATDADGNADDTAAESKSAEQPKEKLPNVALSEEILFKVLSSEIAFQRGQWQAAYVTLMSTAQQTRDPRIAKRAAEMAVTARSPGDALNAVRLWSELAPESGEALQNYLGLIILTDNLTEIEPILVQRLQAATPAVRGPLILQMQRYLTRAKDKAGAFALLERITMPYADILETHLALAQGAAANGDMPRARAEADTAIKIKPDSEMAILTQAQLIQDQPQAMALIKEFLRKYPNAREVRIAYARSLVEQKQYDEARGQFEILLKKQPDDLTTIFALGLLNAQTEHPKQAEKYLTQYVKALADRPNDPRDPAQALVILSQLAEQRNDTQAALKWLEQIEPGDDSYLGAQIRRAQLIAKSGDLAGARKSLAQIDATGEADQIRVTLADSQILRDANQPKAAFDVLAEALKRFPENVDLLYDQAMVADKLSDWGLMESNLRRLITLAPDNQHAYNALGYSLADRNTRLPEAYELIQKALSLAPEDPYITDSLGWVQFRMGNLADAEATLRHAFTLRGDTEIGMHLGEVLWMQGKRDEAQTIWRTVQKQEPDNAALKETLTRLKVHL
jgi:tetratricopeptide (TPR) repeat protein